MLEPTVQLLLEELAQELERPAPSPPQLASIAERLIETGTTDSEPLLLACRAASLAVCEGHRVHIDLVGILRGIVDREPGHVEARVELGIALDVFAHNPKEAIEHLERAVGIEPTSDGVLGLARLYCERGSRRQALALIRAHPGVRESAAGQKLEQEISSGDWDGLNSPNSGC